MLPSMGLVGDRSFQKICWYFQCWLKQQDAELKVEEKEMERKARGETYRTESTESKEL